jgi:hypothetical protein
MRAKRREHPERDDAKYLELRRMGKTIETIALLCGVGLATVHKGIAAAKNRQRQAVQPEPVETAAPRQPAWVREMTPMFPIVSFVPGVACPHKGPIPRGSRFVCAVCHQSGMDAHPALRRDLATEPQPEPKPERTTIKLSRRQKRARTAA